MNRAPARRVTVRRGRWAPAPSDSYKARKALIRAEMNGWATWWVRPSSLVLCFIIPFYILLYNFPNFPFFKLIVVGNIYFDKEAFWYGLFFLTALYLGCKLPIAPHRGTGQIDRQSTDLLLDIVGTLSLIGYVYMFRLLIISPSVQMAALHNIMGGQFDLTDFIERGAAGINSFAQIGIAYFAIFFYVLFQKGRDQLRRRHIIMFCAIVGMTLMRSMFLAQRLALIEITVPGVLFFVHYRARRGGPIELFLMGVFPIISVGLMIGLFGLTEYFRSWADFFKTQDINFWHFIIARMLTYYYTALNNGAILLKVSDWPTFDFFHTCNWLYRLPVISGFFEEMFSQKYFFYERYLDMYANIEFNNNSGIFPIIHELGIAGGALFAFLIGVWLSYCFRCYVASAYYGALYYPMIYLTPVEILRIYYLGSSKIVVQIALLWMVTLLVRQIIEFRRRRSVTVYRLNPDDAAGPLVAVREAGRQ